MRFLMLASVLSAGLAADFESEVLSWRQEREKRLKAPDGWLSVAGLFWLKEGRNEAGSAPSMAIQLPARAPARAGAFTLSGGRVTFEDASGAAKALRDDSSGKPDVIDIAGLKLHIIHRGDRYGVRMKDNESEYRRNFQGLSWYPPRKDWLIQAVFLPYPAPRKMTFDSQTGDKQEMTSSGYVEFEYSGRKLRLTPVLEDGRLFFIFRDKTAGKTTYPAARFLYADPPVKGRVTLDFNKAYNPPCVFTPYATCPLPPPENRLPIEVDAGEQMYKGKH
jgi:uncharacterized protein (DUF1684 family)